MKQFNFVESVTKMGERESTSKFENRQELAIDFKV